LWCTAAAGQKVPVATMGTAFIQSEGWWTIKKGKKNTKLRRNHGMICAEDELGLGKSHDGILILDMAALWK
jgi:phenylalanyl-tRNA synthetase beta chain